MTAATQDIITDKLGTEELPPPALLGLPAEANKIIYGGTMVASNAAGNAVAANDAGALFLWGRAERQVNNLTSNAPYGAAGAQQVLVRPGVYYFANDGSISAANVGQPCFAVDDNTVSLNSSSGQAATVIRPFAGIIVPPGAGVAGAQLSTNTKVPVYVGGANLSPAGMTFRQTVALPLATLQTFTSGTAFNLGAPLPANARLVGAEINVLTPLSGGGATGVAATVQGGADAAGTIIASTSVFTGAAAIIATPGSNPYAARGGQQIKGTVTVTAGTMAGLTAGSLTVDIFYSIVP